MKNNILLRIRLILEYIVIYSFYKLFYLLPINFVSSFGSITFKLIGPFTKTQKIIKKNLLQIFPLFEKNHIKENTKKSWENTGKTFFELLVLPKILNSKDKITIEGKDHINKIVSKKEKAIFIGIHQSNWEILLPSIDRLGIPVVGIYRHINNPFIDKLILKIRKKSIFSNQSIYTPKGKKSAKDILDGIKNNISIVLLIDQKDSAGEIVDFFNYPSKTQTGFIKIARKHNLKIIPVQNIRNKNDTFTLKFHKPIENISNELSDKEVMRNIYKIIETWIKSQPGHWLLQHNRFS